MPHLISRKMIAILATDGFEQSELVESKRLLEKVGAKVHVISPANTRMHGQIRGWDMGEWGRSIKVDRVLQPVIDQDYDALILPGGQMNPDRLRLEPEAIDLIRALGAADKPIAAINHGPSTLIDAGLVRGRRMTSWPSLRNDLLNAGAIWEDAQVVVDRNLVTSRYPGDIPPFLDAFIGVVARMTEEA